jgi:stage II sporulation protein R
MKKTIFLIIAALFIAYISNENEYVEIPSTSIRMRVIAASNSEEDQKEKLIVKSFLEEKLYDLISNKDTYENVDDTILNNENEINEYIQEKMNENGIKAKFTSNYGYNFFPEKEFKGLTYKAGNYKSYVVTLGEGEGENWWCVLYPPLCLVDENAEDYEYHSLINDVLLKYN